MPRSRLRKAKFTSPCPFCGRPIEFGSWMKLSNDLEWMHPLCCEYDDAGKTWADLRKERKRRRVAGLSGRSVELEQRIVSRAKERGMTVRQPDQLHAHLDKHDLAEIKADDQAGWDHRKEQPRRIDL